MSTVYYTATTLDGFLADEQDSLHWLFKQDQDPDGAFSYEEFIADVGAICMGSTTYEWILPHLDGDAWSYQQPTWVFTTRDLPRVEGDVRFVRDDVRPVHADMVAAAEGKDVWVVGGGDLAAQLAEAGLLDRMLLSVAPVTLGAGRPLFPRPFDLRLVDLARNGAFACLTYDVVGPLERPGESRVTDALTYAGSVTTTPEAWTAIDDVEGLVALLGEPGERAATKARPALLDVDRAWLSASPFCVMATADAEGRCDASPKGDPAGSLVHVIDERTIALAERPGNRRADGYRNILANPHVGLNFLIPGRGDTLRVNGRARLVSEAPFFDAMAVKGHRPVLAVVVEIDELFFHCAKAFLRSQLWQPETWDPEAVVPRRAVVAAEVEPAGMTVDQLDDYYRPENYARGLYG